MIHKRSLAAVGAVALFCFFSVPAMAETKIATINFEEVMQSSPQAKAADAKLTGEFGKRKTDLENQGKQLQDDAAKYQRDRDVMTGDARDKTEKDLQQRQVDLQYAQRKAQEEFQTRNRDLVQQVVSQVRAVVGQVAKEKGYDIVISDPVFASPSTDISDEVNKRLSATAAAPGAK